MLAFTALVFGLVVRLVLRRSSARASAWTALILGVVTIMSLAVFWLALPPVFGGGIRDHRSQLKITS